MNSTNPLKGRTALITGGAKRLGRAAAFALAQRGVNVVVHYRSSETEANRLIEELREKDVNASSVQADLAEAKQVERLIREATQRAGEIDILINNASMFPKSTVETVSPEEIQQNMQIHAIAPLILAREFAKQTDMLDVVNLLDARAVDFDREHLAYHLSKRTLLTLTRDLAMELAPQARVNGVAPGLILPPPGETEEYLKKLAHTTPLNRHGCADDIVRAILYLLESPFVTGQVLYVDGGRHMKGRFYE